jgi:hypothetical protein
MQIELEKIRDSRGERRERLQKARRRSEISNERGPQIRTAKDDAGENFLEQWILKNDLLPPALAKNGKGKEDIVLIEVIEPDNEYKVYLPKEEKEN